MISLSRLREVLRYDPETGIFTWRVVKQKRGGRTEIGSRAGSLTPSGYRQLNVDGGHFKEHRLAWFYVHGEWPEATLDHANMDRADNRLANLRPATKSQNNANRKGRARSGLKGAYRSKSGGRWFSHINIDGRLKKLGRFDTAEDAHAAYAAAALNKFGEFSRTD